MKRLILLAAAVSAISVISCNKANTAGTDTSITASTTQATVGQVVTLQVSTSANAVSWTVTPASTASTQFTITDKKYNTVSFSQAGEYLVGVRARHVDFDSAHHNLDSCWHHGGGDRGECTKGKDSASVVIFVK